MPNVTNWVLIDNKAHTEKREKTHCKNCTLFVHSTFCAFKRGMFLYKLILLTVSPPHTHQHNYLGHRTLLKQAQALHDSLQLLRSLVGKMIHSSHHLLHTVHSGAPSNWLA